MKWVSDWNGISIIAETNTEDVILTQLSLLLPEKAYEYYENGKMKLYNQGNGHLVLWFSE